MYQPTYESVTQHPLPEWYQDAKFGIFIHWTISSVPAYAPTGEGDITQIFAKGSPAYAYAHQPYAEWYQNSLRIHGSPAYEYHRKTYGENYPYENFAQTFNEAGRAWDPDSWAELFAQAGARYVVLVTKHHDGFLLWNSRTPNPMRPDYRTERDVTGELTRSVSAKGMKMGLYYSSALDWTFSKQPILDFADMFSSGPVSRTYRRYVEAHWKELIERYQPWLLWSDIAYPSFSNLAALFAHYYNAIPQGVVNDRWFQLPWYFQNPLGRLALKKVVQKIMDSGGVTLPKVPHCDYRTTEYADLQTIADFKWEAVRGIGNSFAYNQFETAADYMSGPDLIRMLADIVSKNGNLLINVGPRPDGSIPEPQAEALRCVGAWLACNGEAIYATRPWTRAGDDEEGGLKVRYTTKAGALYAILLQPPAQPGPLRLRNLPAPGKLSLLSSGQPLPYQLEGSDLLITAALDWASIPVIKIG